MSFKIDLSCPISWGEFTNPVITPCGHAFSYPEICQHLEHSHTCPIDRSGLTMDQLRENIIIRDLTRTFNDITRIFISSHEQAPIFGYKCILSNELLTDPVMLPCHHYKFNETSIVKFSLFTMGRKMGKDAEIFSKKIVTLEDLDANKGIVTCPLCNRECKPSDVVKDILTKQKAVEGYPVFLERIREFNDILKRRIEAEGLDDRAVVQNLLKCPISKKTFEEPMVASCGHTFDRSSFAMTEKCPYDGSVLDIKKAVPNFFFKDIVSRIDDKVSSIFSTLSGSESISGAWLYLSKDSTIKRIEEITKQLGFYAQKPRSIPLFLTAEGRALHSLREATSILQEDAVLRRANHPIQ